MRSILALLTLVVLLPVGTAHSQVSSHQQAALDVLEAMDMENSMTATMDAMMGPMMSQMGAGAPEGMAEAMTAFFQEILIWEDLKPQFAEIYADLFTEEELRGLTEFYSTDLGKQLLAKTPELSARGAGITQAIFVQNQARFMEVMSQLMQGNQNKK